MISTVEIATNRYAPSGSAAINLYSTGLEGGSNLTLGQLVIAVSIRSAAAYEAQSVVKMNEMSSDSLVLDDAAGWMATVADGTADAYFEPGIFLRDIAAGDIILRMAGGRGLTLRRFGGHKIAYLASNGPLHEPLQKVIEPCFG